MLLFIYQNLLSWTRSVFLKIIIFDFFFQLCSDNAYREEYEKEVRGKMKNESIEGYPEYKHAIKVGKNASQVSDETFFLAQLDFTNLLN